MTKKCSQRRTLFFEFDRNSQHPQTLTCPKKICSCGPLQEKKTSGMEVRRTPDVRLRFVIVNFGQIQLLKFVVVMIRSNSFGHLDSVKLITLVLISQTNITMGFSFVLFFPTSKVSQVFFNVGPTIVGFVLIYLDRLID